MATLKTQGTEIFLLDETDTGNEVRKLGQITGGTGVGGEAGEIDVTDLDSVAMEFVTGLKDNGSISLNINWDPQNTSHQTLDALVGGPNKRFLICCSEAATDPTFGGSPAEYTLPATRTKLDFQAGVRSFQKDFTTDEVWRGSVTMRISGDITITPASS